MLRSRAVNVLARSIATSASSSAATSIPPTKKSPSPIIERRADLSSKPLRYLQSITNLSAFDPTLDIPATKHYTPTRLPNQRYDTSVILINDEPNNKGYQQVAPSPDLIDGLPGEDDSTAHLASITDLTPGEIRGLFRFPLIVKRVVSMKSKGKMPSMYSMVVVGNGKGLVGVGEGKDDTANKAVSKAFNQAVRSMDYVERYEDRTVWGGMESNFGSCKIQMRARPPGFGLRVNHYIHQVAKAAGISDLSAKVHGSKNGTRVVKLAISMLHGGSPSLDMGAFGEKGQRKNKLAKGMQTAEEVGRSRGRKAVAI